MSDSAGALLVVSADVPDEADRVPFDQWYRDHHLPHALRVFGALRAWRSWSRIDPSKHAAFYEFPSLAAAKAVNQSAGIKELIAIFDAAWGSRVTRTRDIVEVVQRLPN